MHIDWQKIARSMMRNVLEGEGSCLYGDRHDYAELSDDEYAAMTALANEVDPNSWDVPAHPETDAIYRDRLLAIADPDDRTTINTAGPLDLDAYGRKYGRPRLRV